MITDLGGIYILLKKSLFIKNSINLKIVGKFKNKKLTKNEKIQKHIICQRIAVHDYVYVMYRG